MRIVALVLAVSALSLWLGHPVPKAKSMNALPAQTDERGPVKVDIDDSDLFFQNAIRVAGPQRENSQKIEALLKRMTLRSEEHTSELQSRLHLVCRLLLEKKKKKINNYYNNKDEHIQ